MMLKFLMFLTLLACSSFFVTDAFSLEVELLKESERVIETLGWLKPGNIPFQEQIQLIIDQVKSKNRISITLASTDNEDIRLPSELESEIFDPKIISIIVTNQFNCAQGSAEYACIIVGVDRAGLGDDISTIKENARKITDQLLDKGILGFDPEFHSVFIKSSLSYEIDEPGEPITPGDIKIGEKGIAKVTYTIKKHDTYKLLNAFLFQLISADIINAEGFFNAAEELAKNNFSDFTLTYIPSEQETLRVLSISLLCSNDLGDTQTPYCMSENIDEQLGNGDISPLEFLQLENISRSEIFSKEFLPLNSIIQVIIYSEPDLQVKSVNSHNIKKLDELGDVQKAGWFFASKSGKVIDGRYIFGTESSVSKDSLSFSIGSYTEADTEIKVNEGGGCLIATSAFGTELSPQVQLLREIRDNTILQTESGSAFMAGFNQFYYSFSPTIADYERENLAFKESVKLMLTPLLVSLTLLQFVDIDSEYNMLGFGIGIILLNIGMYFVAPAVLIMKAKKRICLKN